MSLQPILNSTHLPSDIEPLKAADTFKSQRDVLTDLLQHDLPNMASKLYTKSIISAAALAEAMNQVHIASVRTVSLLSVVEDKIRAEPRVFTEFVKILESEPTLRSQAIELVEKYIKGSYVHPKTPATSSVISRYGDYLEGVYSRSTVSSDGKFPPTPSKTYVNLAVVEHASEIRDIEEVRENTLHGRVDEMIKGKTKIEITDILKPHVQYDGKSKPVSLVFVEGPPGIGKSTLAWELCRRWDRKQLQYDLAVLLRLREREVQQIESIVDLFPHIDKELQQCVSKEVVYREGRGVLFVLDGYDELPIILRHQGLFNKLLKKEILPECTVLVTSRPSATRDLFRACRPQIQRHIETLGFTQESVMEYASIIFSSQPDVLKDFLIYISAAKNPAINSLMYIPLNAAIIVEIYKNSRRKGCPIPKTMTQVYTQLCLTLLQRGVESIDPANTRILCKFSDLPESCSEHFKELSCLALKKFEQNQVVFYSDDKIPSENFGFLDSVQPLYCGGEISYNFLHLTLQEFLAAYHITQLSNGIDVFKHHSEDRRWEVVWRFVSGLTRFQYFMDSVRCDAFVSESEDDEFCKIKNLLLHCLFEGQLVFDYMAVLGKNRIRSLQGDRFGSGSSPLDRYALGYCIANCSSTTSWNVHVQLGSDESFIWGLNSNNCGNGGINHLEMINVSPTCLDSYPSKVLLGIKHLDTDRESSPDTNTLMHVLPLMKNLTFLSLHGTTEMAPVIFDIISQTNITALRLIFHADVLSSLMFVSSLDNLISSPSCKLKDLTIELKCSSVASTKPLCDVLFGLSSLTRLALELPYCTENSFDLLETNTCLTTVQVFCRDSLPPPQPLFNILQNNKTIQRLEWGCFNLLEDLDLLAEQLETLNMALSSNTTLKELTLDTRLSQTHLSSLICDVRVMFNYNFVTFKKDL